VARLASSHSPHSSCPPPAVLLRRTDSHLPGSALTSRNENQLVQEGSFQSSAPHTLGRLGSPLGLCGGEPPGRR
jgi:hypothetical protein